jgi:hypothetical protein
MDFQPQNPEDPLVTVAALMGHGIPGVFVHSGSCSFICFFCFNDGSGFCNDIEIWDLAILVFDNMEVEKKTYSRASAGLTTT